MIGGRHVYAAVTEAAWKAAGFMRSSNTRAHLGARGVGTLGATAGGGQDGRRQRNGAVYMDVADGGALHKVPGAVAGLRLHGLQWNDTRPGVSCWQSLLRF